MTLHSPQVSVIIPVRNALPHLARTSAALARLSPDVEVIILDDASDDGTAEVLRAAAQQNGWYLEVAPSPRGAALTRLRGIERATGTWVWFTDVDDVWHDGILEVLLSAAERTKADIVCCRAKRRELDGHTWIMEGSDHELLLSSPEALAQSVITGVIRGYLWNKLFRRTTLGGEEREHLSSQDDFLTTLDALARSTRVTLIPDVLYEYHEHPGSISTVDLSQLENTHRCADIMLSSWLSRMGYPASRGERAYFLLWFELIPTATTPVHRRWPRDLMRAARRSSARRITPAGIAECVRRRRFDLVAHAFAVWLPTTAYSLLYRAARRVSRSRSASAEKRS